MKIPKLRALLGQGAQAAQQVPQPTQSTATTIGQKIGQGIKSVPKAFNLGEKLGSGAKSLYTAPSNLLGGVEKGLFGTSGDVTKNLGLLAQGGYLANLGAKKMTGTSLTEAMFGDAETMVPQETQKWRTKATTDVLQNFTPKGFDAGALDLSHNNSDEGWRAGIKAMGKDEFNKMAKDAVTSGDAEPLYNAIVKKSMASGKKVNFSKPLYIPAMFSKEGKKFGYALVKGEDGATPKLVKIELGKGVSFDE